jgi:DNA-directed RNA polymerase specialized sigma24 family protein
VLQGRRGELVRELGRRWDAVGVPAGVREEIVDEAICAVVMMRRQLVSERHLLGAFWVMVRVLLARYRQGRRDLRLGSRRRVPLDEIELAAEGLAAEEVVELAESAWRAADLMAQLSEIEARVVLVTATRGIGAKAAARELGLPVKDARAAARSACAQTTSQWQRHGRYHPESNRHPGKMLPALARRAIETYSDPGDLRPALGLELEPRWAKLARANIHHARHHGARQPARVIEGDAQNLPRLLAGHTRRTGAGGGVDLILTSPRRTPARSRMSPKTTSRADSARSAAMTPPTTAPTGPTSGTPAAALTSPRWPASTAPARPC